MNAASPRSNVNDMPGTAGPSLPLRALLFLYTVGAVALAATTPTLLRMQPRADEWVAFGVLAACAAVAQLFVVRVARDQSSHTAIVFLVAAALLLPPGLVVLTAIVQHVPEWLKLRHPWHIQTFNICNYVLSGLAASGVGYVLAPAGVAGPGERFALGGLAACAVFVALNHSLLAGMLHVVRGQSLRTSGLFTSESLGTDLVLATLGLALASLWELDLWLIPTVIAPLVLIQRSLSVPALREQARIDAKTGLFNARHFSSALDEELRRSARFGRPLSLLVADLDYLREVNNSFGHLAGDDVLRGVAEIFREHLRPYDVPARFGGEEFAILLPETDPEQAAEIADRIRAAVAGRAFLSETAAQPIRATISIGVASYPRDAVEPKQLLHEADIAVYRAKVQGRDRVVDCGSEPTGIGPAGAPVFLGMVQVR